MSAEYSMICDYATTDKSGKLIIIGIFDKMSPISFPYVHPSFFYVSKLVFEKKDFGIHKFSLEILNTDSTSIIPKIPGNITVKKDDLRETGSVNFVLQLNNILFKEEGTYFIELSVDETKISSIPMYIIKTS